MKQAKILAQFFCGVALAALLPGCSTTDSSASAVANTETMLAQAGFSTYPAKNDKHTAHIQKMPAARSQR